MPEAMAATAAPAAAAAAAAAAAPASPAANSNNKSKPQHSRGANAVWVAKSELSKLDSPAKQPDNSTAISSNNSSSNNDAPSPPPKVVSSAKADNGNTKKREAKAADEQKKVPSDKSAKADNSATNNKKQETGKAEDTKKRNGKAGAAKRGEHQGAESHASANPDHKKAPSPTLPQPVPQTLARQTSLSKLNAGAAVFVPKQSTSLPSALTNHSSVCLSRSSLASQSPLLETCIADTELTSQEPNTSSHVPQKPVALTDKLRSQIVQQVEFYFSDVNLSTDSYLLKHIKKDPEGFVPIPLIGSFKKLRQIIKNHALLAAALRTSTKLVVSEDGKRVKRAEAFESSELDEIQSRMVVAENLPEDHSVENLEKLFETVGSVKSIRVCEPETATGVNQALKQRVDQYVSNKLHALVEYETVEQAEKAVADLTDQRNWRSGLHVRLLLRRIYPASKQHNQQHGKARKNQNEPGEGGDDEVLDVEENGLEGNEEGGEDASSRRSSGGNNNSRGRGRGRGGGGRGSKGASVNGMLGSSLGSSSLGEAANSGNINNNGGNINSSSGSSGNWKPPPGPRMPDGTRGFTFGRGCSLVPPVVVKE